MGAPPVFRLPSARIRVQRWAPPVATSKTLARIAASLAMAVGVTAATSVVPHSGGAFVAAAVTTVLGFAMALIALLPLGLILVWTGLAALVSRSRPGAVSVGAAVVVENGGDDVSFSPADVLAIDAREPGAATIRLEDGDLVRAEIDDTKRIAELARALVGSREQRIWVAPLHPRELPAAWPRYAALVATWVVALGSIASLRAEIAAAAIAGSIGLSLWLTVLRPGPVRQRLRMGADGISLRTDVGARFVPFTRIERVEPEAFGAVLALHGGERLPLPVVAPALLLPDSRGTAAHELAAMRRSVLLERLTAALGGIERLAGEERLARQGRRFDAWREAVRDMVRTDAGGYRAALLSTEQASRIVESGHAAPEARIGAALALAASADTALKQRLRVALEASVDETTRKAITEALEDRLEPWRLELVEATRGE